MRNALKSPTLTRTCRWNTLPATRTVYPTRDNPYPRSVQLNCQTLCLCIGHGGRVYQRTALADELELACSSLKAITRNHLHGPISCTVVLRQLARIGQSGTQ